MTKPWAIGTGSVPTTAKHAAEKGLIHSHDLSEYWVESTVLCQNDDIVIALAVGLK